MTVKLNTFNSILRFISSVNKKYENKCLKIFFINFFLFFISKFIFKVFIFEGLSKLKI